MNRGRHVVFVLASMATLAPTAVRAQSEDSLRQYRPADLVWTPGPSVLPPGMEGVNLVGSATQPGPFTNRMRWPAGYRLPPHFHNTAARVTVISGTLYLGMGARFDTAGARPLPAGSFVVVPAGHARFEWVREQTVIQTEAIGPFDITYIDPRDDPRRRTK